jgi:hypothetical protein
MDKPRSDVLQTLFILLVCGPALLWVLWMLGYVLLFKERVP